MAVTRQGIGPWRTGRLPRITIGIGIGIGGLLLVCTAYAVSPFVALWRISHAIDAGDTATLRAMIDWPAVRQGLKDDITDGIIGVPRETLVASNSLPPFGASFVSGIAASAIERAVSPQSLVQAARVLAPVESSAGGSSWPSIVGAGFASLSAFDMTVRAPCQEADEAPMRIRLEFRRGIWTISRVWVPQDLMDRADTRT